MSGRLTNDKPGLVAVAHPQTERAHSLVVIADNSNTGFHVPHREVIQLWYRIRLWGITPHIRVQTHADGIRDVVLVLTASLACANPQVRNTEMHQVISLLTSVPRAGVEDASTLFHCDSIHRDNLGGAVVAIDLHHTL